MALNKDVVESFAALKRAEVELEETVNDNYRSGTRVSFRKFTYHGIQDVPVLTGTVLWASVKTGDFPKILLRIKLDDNHCPCEWEHANGTKDAVLINILEKEYDITIIGKDENIA